MYTKGVQYIISKYFVKFQQFNSIQFNFFIAYYHLNNCVNSFEYLKYNHRTTLPYIREVPMGCDAIVRFFNCYFPFNQGLSCATEEPLLGGTNPVQDSFFTATSQYGVYFAPKNARLSTVCQGWLASTAELDAIGGPMFYLQASLRETSIRKNRHFFTKYVSEHIPEQTN